MAEIEAIEIGAKIEIGGSVGRITNVWVDEDGVAEVTIQWIVIPYDQQPDQHVTAEDVREMMKAGELERTNSAHEAWQWRVQNIEGI